MENGYAGALMRLIEKGVSPKEAVGSIERALRLRGRVLLLPRVGRAFARMSAQKVTKSQSLITVARAEDEEVARKASGFTEAVVHIDPSIIGGWRAERADTLVDASYKKHLLAIYNRATRA